MDEARFTLAIGGLSHAEAFAVMERMEEDLRIETIAVTINETDEAAALWETVGWFASESDAQDAREALRSNGVIAPVPQRDWVRESLLGLAPVSAGRFFLHGSHDRAARREGGISLEIDAGTAFGTGHHGTTWGCLEALDVILKQTSPRNILDLGTGTGVLALAAAKALRRRVLATDIDAEAVRVAKLNAANNGAGPLLRGVTAPGLKHRAIAGSAPFDLIFANILARPLAVLAPGLSSALAAGGWLVLSGLTADQLRRIRACYVNQGLATRRVIRCGNWIALVMRKPLAQKESRASSAARLSKSSSAKGMFGLGWAQDL